MSSQVPPPPQYPGHAGPPGQQQPPQPYPYPPHSHQRTNGMAIASLVLGIVGLFLFVFFMIPNILAVVFGFVGLSQIKQAPPGAVAGRGLAIAGLVMGFVGIGLFLLLLPFGNFQFHFGGG